MTLLCGGYCKSRDPLNKSPPQNASRTQKPERPSPKPKPTAKSKQAARKEPTFSAARVFSFSRGLQHANHKQLSREVATEIQKDPKKREAWDSLLAFCRTVQGN